MSYPRANGMNEFYSRCKAGGGIELFVDRHGNPTTSYPHIHIVHHPSGQVDIVARSGSGSSAWRTSLNNPSGSSVEAAIRQAATHL
jgi:hypothetical protein